MQRCHIIHYDTCWKYNSRRKYVGYLSRHLQNTRMRRDSPFLIRPCLGCPIATNGEYVRTFDFQISSITAWSVGVKVTVSRPTICAPWDIGIACCMPPPPRLQPSLREIESIAAAGDWHKAAPAAIYRHDTRSRDKTVARPAARNTPMLSGVVELAVILPRSIAVTCRHY